MNRRHARTLVALLGLASLAGMAGAAAPEGRLLGAGTGATAERFRQMGPGRYMLVPGIPVDGKHIDAPLLTAVIDSGVASGHPQLAGYLVRAADFTGEGAEDALGHGTAVALALLYGQGQAQPPSALLSAKVVGANGRIKQSAVIEAIDWAVAQGAWLVNLSLGFEGERSEFDALCAAVERAPNVLFVAAAGNSGPHVSVYPAHCGVKNLIAVAEVGADGRLAPSSGAGDVAAPSNTPFVEEWRYYYEAAQAQARAGHMPAAEALYRKSLHAQPNAESEFQLGVLRLHANEPEKARQHFQAALQLFPAMAPAREHLGLAYYLMNDDESAERELRDAIDLAPEVARLHFNLGMALMRQGKLEGAHDSIREALRLDPAYAKARAALQSIEAKRQAAR